MQAFAVTYAMIVIGVHQGQWTFFKDFPGPGCSKVDNAIHRINHYPADNVVCFVNTYPLDSDLSDG